VESGDIEISSEPGGLVVTGARRLPAAAQGMEIQRVEIPHGRFERRIPLPATRWQLSRSTLVDGCLLLSLTKQV
jgi:HSP20 family molecular chaperone IbpA